MKFNYIFDLKMYIFEDQLCFKYKFNGILLLILLIFIKIFKDGKKYFLFLLMRNFRYNELKYFVKVIVIK